MDAVGGFERAVYGASYVPAYVIWNGGGKYVWRLIAMPAIEAWYDVIVTSAQKDAKNAAFTSVSFEDAVKNLLEAVYGSARRARRREHAAAAHEA